MIKFRNIVSSIAPPPTDCLWIDNGELKYFNNGWVALNKTEVIVEKPTIVKEVVSLDIYKEYKKAGGTKSKKEFIQGLVDLMG